MLEELNRDWTVITRGTIKTTLSLLKDLQRGRQKQSCLSLRNGYSNGSRPTNDCDDDDDKFLLSTELKEKNSSVIYKYYFIQWLCFFSFFSINTNFEKQQNPS